jgi:hypothetical protein
MLGMLIGRALPAHHVSADMKGTVSLALGVIGTLSALVIGLLMAGGSSSWGSRSNGTKNNDPLEAFVFTGL